MLSTDCWVSCSFNPTFYAKQISGCHLDLLDSKQSCNQFNNIPGVSAVKIQFLTYLCVLDMILCMRTTIDIDDKILALAKKQALEKGTHAARQMLADASTLQREAFDISYLAFASKCTSSSPASPPAVYHGLRTVAHMRFYSPGRRPGLCRGYGAAGRIWLLR